MAAILWFWRSFKPKVIQEFDDVTKMYAMFSVNVGEIWIKIQLFSLNKI